MKACLHIIVEGDDWPRSREPFGYASGLSSVPVKQRYPTRALIAPGTELPPG
jgi:hypothetical protein